MILDTNLLKTLEEVLEEIHPSLFKRLTTGIAKEEIDKIASANRVDFCEEVYDLFTWKNGVSHMGISSVEQLLIFPDGIPFSIMEAVGVYNSHAITKQLFEPDYFPLFSDGNENILLINLDEDNAAYKTICLYSPSLLGTGTPIPIYDSLVNLITTVIACYQKKAFWLVNDCLEVDSDAHYSIASNLNPNSQYWQYM
ncbi:hypothetical protein OHD16_13205 [Sphingobacterium sp. ML3W]|uniref:hypothetical protein n=1 Tax=Sphingobacterium sp. ML3W TaxID=1538644 RepID=UPI002499F79D|nr:hypothetical protein [Sphingobacterium sp. ML3W]WFA80917.1 hypothetical protein OGI71_06350 [Sphingobacterium sp. ML3W]